MDIKLFEGGQWKSVKVPKVFTNGAWTEAKRGLVFKNGVWTEFYKKVVAALPEPRGELAFKIVNKAIKKSTNFNGNDMYSTGGARPEWTPVTDSTNARDINISSQLWQAGLYIDGIHLRTVNNNRAGAREEYDKMKNAFNNDSFADLIIMNDATGALFHVNKSTGFTVESDEGSSSSHNPKTLWIVQRKDTSPLFDFLKAAFDNNQTISAVGLSGPKGIPLVPSGELAFKQDRPVEEGGYRPGSESYYMPLTNSPSRLPVTDSTNLKGAVLSAYHSTDSSDYMYIIAFESILHAGKRSSDSASRAAVAQAKRAMDAFRNGGKIVIQFADGEQFVASVATGWKDHGGPHFYVRGASYFDVRLTTTDSKLMDKMRAAAAAKEHAVMVGIS